MRIWWWRRGPVSDASVAMIGALIGLFATHCGSADDATPAGAGGMDGGATRASSGGATSGGAAGTGATSGASGSTGAGGRGGSTPLDSGVIGDASQDAIGPEARVDGGDADGGKGTGDGGVFAACGAMGIASVRDVAYLPDGSAVVAGLAGAVAKLIDPVDGREVRSFMGHTGGVNAVAVTADGKTLATASDDRTVRLWRISDGVLLGTLAGHTRELLSIAISPDGTHLAAGAADGEVFLWRRSDAKLIAVATGHVDEVRGIGFAAVGTRLFTASKDGSVRVWSAVDLAPLAVPVQGGVPLAALAVSADGVRVAVSDPQGGLTFWRASDAGFERRVQGTFGITRLAFAPDGTRVYGITGSSSVYGYPVDGSASTLLVSPIGSSDALAVAPNGRALFLVTNWALWLTDETGHSIRDPIQQGPFAHSVAFWPDSSRLVIGGTFGFVVRTLPGGGVLQAPDWGQFADNYDGVAIAPDTALLATADALGHVRLWSTSTWQSVKDVVTAGIRAQSVAFSPDGTLLATAGSPGLDDVYRVPTGEFVMSMGYSDYVHSITFSPDGTLIGVGTEDRKLGILKTSDWSDVRRIDNVHNPIVADLAFSPDNQIVASTGDERVTVWQVTGSTVRHDLLSDSSFLGSTVAIAPDGTLLVAGGSDGKIRLWSLPDLRVLPELPAHGPGVLTARFSHDGRQLAAAYGDGTVWLWCR